MMKKRGLIIGGYDTAAHGFTMTKLSLQTPPIVEDFVQVDGMHGSLDYCDATGDVVYQTRPLEAVFELSEGNFAEREKVLTEMIRSIHGKKCPIVHPDHGGKLLEGRVKVSKDFNNLAYAQVSLTAVCQPWFTDPCDTVLTLPILDRSHNLITYDNVEFMQELSTCPGGRTGDTEAVTVTLFTEPADIHSYAVFRAALSANTTYYLSGRMYGRGYWRANNAPEMPDAFSPVVTTGDDGYLYLFVARLESYGYLGMNDVVCVNSSEASILHNGSFPAGLQLEKPESLSGILVSVGGVSKRHYSKSVPEITANAGDLPVLAFRHDTSDEALTETIRFKRRWLE